MKQPNRRRIVHGIIVCALAFAGCRQKASAPGQSAEPTPTTAQRNVIQGKVDACTYLTSDDAAAVLGGPVQPAKISHEDLARTHASRCAYLTSGQPLRVVNLLLQQLPNPEQAAKAVEFTRETAPTVSGAPPQDVPGLGEKAFWVGGSVNKLHVLRGNLWLTLGASLGPGLDQEAPARAAAERVLQRFSN